MASKSAYSDADKGAEIEEALDELDKLVDRLRVMYEQYFMGIQKQAPSHLHSEAERKIRELTQLNIRNTGLRYRFATIGQKFGSYNNYWRRTLREIEAGRYVRDLNRIKRQAYQRGEVIPDEIVAAMPKRMREMVERDRKAAEARAARNQGALPAAPVTADEALDEAAMVHSAPPPRPHAYTLDMDEDLDVDAMFDDITGAGDKIAPPIDAAPVVPVVRPPAPTPTVAPPVARPTVAPPVPPARTTLPPLFGGKPVVSAPVAAPPVATRPAATTEARTTSLRRVNDTIPTPAPRGASDTIPTPMREFDEDAPTPIHNVPIRSVPMRPATAAPPLTAAGAPRPATTRAPVPTRAPVAPARPPARVQPLEPPPGMTEADTRALYAKFMKARALVGEKNEDMTYDRLLKTLRVQGSKIIDQYKAKGVEFGVVIKDNRVVLKAKPKV